MSRSYKKTPRAGDTKHKSDKRRANHRIRRQKNKLFQGNMYKKINESWEICDYQSILTFEQFYEDAIRQWYMWRYRYESFPSREDLYQKWFRWYKMK